MKLFKKISLIALMFLGLQFAAATPAAAQTSPWEGVCIERRTVDGETFEVATIQGFQCLVANILSVFLTIVGIAGFIMLIIASFQLLVSGGESQKVEKAKKSVTNAVIGLAVAVGAFIILNLIAGFTGVNTILEFKIPGDDPGVFVPTT